MAINAFSILSLLGKLGYLGAFLVSLLGTMTIIFPIPYLITLYIMATTKMYNPLLLGLVSGLGATFGELTLYVLARLGRFALSEKKLKDLEYIKRYLDKYGWIAVFIFAATPLPDDILYPFLGLIKYDMAKIVLSCFAGKTILTISVVYAGMFSVDILRYVTGSPSLYINVIVIIIMILSVILILKINWSEVFMKLMEGKA